MTASKISPSTEIGVTSERRLELPTPDTHKKREEYNMSQMQTNREINIIAHIAQYNASKTIHNVISRGKMFVNQYCKRVKQYKLQ